MSYLVRRPIFTDYAVLGDDIVIANGSVARSYLQVMAEIGVKISIAKSLVSRSGHLEFAKRFLHSGENIGPLPYSEVIAACGSISAKVELVRK